LMPTLRKGSGFRHGRLSMSAQAKSGRWPIGG
jgi:hypothetical protein